MDHLLEGVLLDPSVEPTNLQLLFLKTITNDFSDDAKIGSGGFAAVYKGVLQSGAVVAVKKLVNNPDMDDKKFTREVGCLMKAKHKNIVRFLGYCSDTQGKILNHEGKMIQAEERQRLLCFEFLPKGSLDNYITDVSGGLEWTTCYKIIKGICEGLHYLHQDICIVHSDLKPANILLDKNMVPKISDFGLARFFEGKESKIVPTKLIGTWGYMAPELFQTGTITFKTDIYSLGIIIMEILTGQKGNYDIQNVLESWSTRFQMSDGGLWSEHVRGCAMIALECLDSDPTKRPITRQIIERLDELDCTYGSIETNHSAIPVLDVYPLYIWFPSESDSKVIKCPVTLTNKTDDFIGVLIAPTSLDACSNLGYPYVWQQREHKSSIFKSLEPHSSEIIHMTLRNYWKPPQQADGEGLFDVAMVAIKSKRDLELLDQHWNSGEWMENKSEDRLIRAKELGTVVHLATLRAAVSSDLARRQEVAVHQFIQREVDGNFFLKSSDVLPSKAWLLLGHDGKEGVSIWNYETQERVMKVEVKHLKEVIDEISSVKFIAEEKWFAAGDCTGHVHVYSYTNFGAEKVKELEAYVGNPIVCAVDTLGVFPKHTLLLTASFGCTAIKLWDWSQGWTCTRIIDTHGRVWGLKVNPRDASTFGGCCSDDKVKVWDIHSPDAIATFQGSEFTFYTESGHDFLATNSGYGNYRQAKIWDIQTMKHVHTLDSFSECWFTSKLCFHPTLPILAVMTELNRRMHKILLRDVRTYRVVKRLELIMDGRPGQMVFNVTKGITRAYRKSQMLINSKILHLIWIEES